MIEQLQKKFVVIAISSLMLIIVVIIGAVNLLNLYQASHRMDGGLRMVADHDGEVPEFEHDQQPSARPFSYDFQMTQETRFEMRYFTVVLSEDDIISTVDASHIASVTEQQAQEYAVEILAKNRTSGYLDNQYRYLVAKKPYGTLVIVMNCYTQLQAVTVFFWTSCLIAFISLLLMFLLVSFLSRHAIRPVHVSIEKQKQFITDAGHELKTPLAIISSNADVLELKHGSDEWLASIRRQTTRMDDLVKKLLSLSRIEEESIRQSFADVSLSDVVWETVESFQTLAEAQGNHIVCDIAPKVLLYGDKEGLCQLIGILLDNAVKYVAPEGQIDLRLSAQGKRITLEVSNHVASQPTVDPERFFDRFYRADPSRSRESGGYGIGLSIARAIVDAHRGTIQAAAQKNRVCFKVLLWGKPERSG